SGSGAISTTAGVSSAAFSMGWVAPSTGTYYWQASYVGDSNNNGFTAPCGAAHEVIVVGPGTPAIGTQALPASVPLATAPTIRHTATFKETPAVAPTGSVTFTLYTDATCATSTGISGSVAISTTAGVSSAAFSTTWNPPAPGIYFWRAAYPGDANNDGFTTTC